MSTEAMMRVYTAEKAQVVTKVARAFEQVLQRVSQRIYDTAQEGYAEIEISPLEYNAIGRHLRDHGYGVSKGWQGSYYIVSWWEEALSGETENKEDGHEL